MCLTEKITSFKFIMNSLVEKIYLSFIFQELQLCLITKSYFSTYALGEMEGGGSTYTTPFLFMNMYNGAKS